MTANFAVLACLLGLAFIAFASQAARISVRVLILALIGFFTLAIVLLFAAAVLAVAMFF